MSKRLPRRQPVARKGDDDASPHSALQDSEARLRAILQTAVEGIITIDERGHIESANPAALRVFGYSFPEIAGRNVSMLMPQPDSHRHDGYLAQYRRTGVPRIIGIGREVAGRRKDGSVFPMDLSVSEVHLSGQRMFTGFVRDISERKRAEARQQLQLAVTQALAESTSVSDAARKVLQTLCSQLNWERGELWHHDQEAHVLRFAESWQKPGASFRAFEAITRSLAFDSGLGLPGDVLASRQPIWVPDIANDRAFARGTAALSEGFRAAFAFPILLGNEVLGVMEFLSRELRQPDEQQLLIFASIGSQLGQFMERKRAEDAARREHAFSSAILDTASALVIVLDRAGHVVRFNPACERITGCKFEEVRGRHFADLFLPPEERDEVLRLFGNLAAGSFPKRHENHWLTHQGEKRWIAWSNSAIVGPHRQVEYVIGTGIDMTDQKRLEQEILGISELEQRRIGHDLHDGLCQHLAGLEFMSQTLQQRLESVSKADAACAGQIAGLVRQAITQTRDLAHGLSPVMREAGGLTSALQSLAQSTAHLFRVTCRFVCPRPVPVSNDTAAAHVYRIAQEAVSNALRHGRAMRVIIRLESNGSQGLLSVRDNGIGFAAGPKQANGMGLGIMRYRAAMMGGKVEIRTKPGRGVTVTCSFPLAHALPSTPRRP